MMKAAGKIKEDHACFPPPYTSNDVHGAVIDPVPRNTPTYSWKKCGNCTFIGTTSEAGVTYGATSATKPSESRNDQELTVTAVVKGDDGQTASATCTTNFTVVKVDVTLNNWGELMDESPKLIVPSFVHDIYGGLSKKAKMALKEQKLRIEWEPVRLPGNELFSLQFADGEVWYDDFWSYKKAKHQYSTAQLMDNKCA